VLPWYRDQRFRYAAAALLAGLVIGGIVTIALGHKSSSLPPISDRSDAEAIASDHAAVAKPAAKATAAPKPAVKPRRKHKHSPASVAVTSAAAEPAATSTPDDEEHGSSPASTRAPVRSAPRRSAPRVVSKPRTQITPVVKKAPAKPAPTPRPAAPAPTPAPTAAPPAPAPTANPGPPHRPPGGHHGGGDDDDPGTS
jgi:hypothetical protein